MTASDLPPLRVGGPAGYLRAFEGWVRRFS